LTVGSLGQIVVSPTICNLCGVCETNCPVGALEIHEGIVYVCDLCGGRPACVEACTEKALEFEPGASEILSLKEHKEKSRGLNPGEKRRLFIESEGAPIRSLWEKGRG
jgi:Fe-S-cluster-containing dehydrogenase component